MAKPLLKKDRNGKTYTRPPEIEAAIDLALSLDLESLVDRAALRDEKSAAYVPSECLVHLLREFLRRGLGDAVNKLLPVFLARCGRILSKSTAVGYVPNIESLNEEILAQFAMLFAEDGRQESSSALDFYEVRFGMAFRALRISISKAEHERTESLVSFSDSNDEGEELSESEVLGRTRPAVADFPSLENLVLQHEIAEAIKRLPKKERDAVVLHFHYGYEIESEDPTKRTVAMICGVTGRTVRNRLRRAGKMLAAFKEMKK
jgi:DNA primase large subunit